MISVTYLWTSILACIRRFKPGSMLINSAAFGGRKATLGRMSEKRTIAWLVADLNFEVASTRYRAVYPAAGLNKNGWTCRLFDRPESIRTELDQLAAIVIVKRLDPRIIQVVSYANDAGVPVILDLCDDVLSIDYRNDAHEMFRMVFSAIVDRLSLIVVTGGVLQRRLEDYGVDPSKLRIVPDCVESAAVVKLGRSFFDVTPRTPSPEAIKSRLLGIAFRAAKAVRHPRRSLLDWRGTLRTIRHGEAPAPKPIAPDADLRKALGLREPIVVWFGNHGGPHSDFGMLTLLRVASELREVHARSPFTLVVVSDHRLKWKLFIEPIGVPTRFVLWSQEAARRLLERAAAFIMPVGEDEFSLAKSANRAVLALDAGAPVVASPLESLLPLGPSVAPADFADALERCLTHRTEARAEAARLRNEAEKNFGLRKIVETWDAILREARPYKKLRNASGVRAANEKLLVMINLAQDLPIALSVIDEARNRGANVGVIVGMEVANGNQPLIEALIDRRIAPTFTNPITAKPRDFRWLRGATALFCPTETSLEAHALAHMLTKLANDAGVATFTAQHGLENVGLTWRRSDLDTVAIASSTIFTWAAPSTLPSWVSPDIRSRCIGLGRLSRRWLADADGSPGAQKPIIAVFENLHWERYDDSARDAFRRNVAALANALPEADVIVGAHPGGRWAAGENAFGFGAARVVNPAAEKVDGWTTPRLLRAASAVLTTPSTIALDAAESGRPVAVMRCGITDLASYEPLPIIDGAIEFISFAQAALAGAPAEGVAAFADRVRIPGDPTERAVDLMLPATSAAAKRHQFGRMSIAER